VLALGSLIGGETAQIADSVLENDQARGVVYGAHISHSCAPV